jgi:hypothetical protein
MPRAGTASVARGLPGSFDLWMLITATLSLSQLDALKNRE